MAKNYTRPPKFMADRMALLHMMLDADRAWIHAIEESAFKRFGVPLADVMSKRKSGKIPEARGYIAVRLRATTQITLTQLATLYGGDHSTYVLLVKRYKSQFAGDLDTGPVACEESGDGTGDEQPERVGPAQVGDRGEVQDHQGRHQEDRERTGRAVEGASKNENPI